MATRYEQEVFKLGGASDTPLSLAELYKPTSAVYTVADAISALDRKMDMLAIAADMRFAINPSAALKVSEMLGEYKPTASLVQEFTVTDYGLNIDALRPSWQSTVASHYPLSQYMSDLLPAADIGVTTSSWKPILMRESWPPEISFVGRMSVAEQKLYSAIRPEILSVADLLGQTSQLPLQSMLVDYMGTPFEIDFDFYLDLDTPPSHKLAVPAPLRHPRVVLKKVVVWIADRPEKVELIGLLVGEAAGQGATMMIDGAAGDWAGGLGAWR